VLAAIPGNGKTVAELQIRIVRQADTVGFPKRLDARRNVHTVAGVDAHAGSDRLALRDTLAAVGNLRLWGDREFDSGEDGRKQQQQPFAHGLDDATVLPIDELGSKRSERGKRAGFVRTYQARITDDISGYDGSQPALGPLPAC
jgi:hypothetical protein